jgi:hypothetical protein
MITVAQLGLISTLGVAYFGFVFALLHFLDPATDAVGRAGSEYVLGPYGVLMTTCFLALGLALATVAAAFGRVLPASRAWAGFAIAAVGLVVVAVIPTDRGVAATTTSGLIHNLTGLVSFLAVVISEVGLSRAMRHNTRLAAYANGFSRLALLATATFVLVFLAAGPFVSVGVFGLAQRLFLACALLWIFLASLRLRAISMPAHADTTGIVRV